MPIRIIVVGEDRSAPAVFCDQCQQKIEKATDGNVEWRGIDIAETYFTHKQCSQAFRKANPMVRLSMELALFPLRLAYNLEIDLDDANERLERLAELS